MNPLQNMELHKNQFTPNDLLIYNTIMQSPSRVTHMTTSVLAAECGVSQPALSRFIKSLGYDRYQNFRADLISWLAQQAEQDEVGANHLGYFNQLYELLQESETLMTREYMTQLAGYVDSFDHIYASGMAKSYQPALLLETLLRKNKRYVQAIHSESLKELGDFMEDNDLVIIFSVSAQSAILNDGKVMLITANPHNNYEKKIDKSIVLPYIPPSPETSSVSPILFSVFVELLASFISRDQFKD